MWIVGRFIFAATISVHPVSLSVRIAAIPNARPKAPGMHNRFAFDPGSPHGGGNPVRSAKNTPTPPSTAQIANAGHPNTAACAGERKTCGKNVSISFTATRYAISPAYTSRDTRSVRVIAPLLECTRDRPRRIYATSYAKISSAARVCWPCSYREGCTTPTLFTPLQAIYTRPSGVATMLRTVPPPEGIGALANCSVFGSKRTIVFGFTPDSLYQTAPSG